MKNAMKALVLVLCVAMMVSIFTACGDVSGEYTNETTNTTFDFSTFGNKVTKTTINGGKTTTEEFTYELNEEGTEITFTDADGDSSTWSFEQGEDYIKMGIKTGIGDLGLVTYTKA